MDWDRREVLRALGVATLGSFAGCNSGSSSDPSETNGQPNSDGGMGGFGGDTPTTTPSGTLVPTTSTSSTAGRTDTHTPTSRTAGGSDTQTPTSPATATPARTVTPDVTPTPGVTATPTPGGEPGGSIQLPKILPDDGDSFDQFGLSVALSGDGDTALVSAPKDEDPNGKAAGSAYVFSKASGTWSQQAKLAPDDGDARDVFGKAVALSVDGDTALVGAYADEDPNGKRAGSAYVFSRANGSWSQQTGLAPDDGDDGDVFGWSAALSNDGATALVAAPGEEDPNGKQAGAAYVFSKASGSWSQRTKLAPEDADDGDVFGWSVAVSADGTTALVGAYGNEDPNGEKAGSAYVFSKASGSWSQRAKLLPDDGDDGDQFGWSAALSGDGNVALVGALADEDPHGKRAGSAYVFSRAGGSWSQRTKLAPDDGDDGDVFGGSAALSGDGDTALVGAYGDEDPNGKRAGAAYLFSRADGSWSQRTKLSPPQGDRGGLFGQSTALSATGATALAGAYWNLNRNGTKAGAAYLFDV